MGAPYLVSEPTRQQLEQLIEDRRVDAGSAGGTWAVRQLATPSGVGTPTSYVYGVAPGAGVGYNSATEVTIKTYTVTEGAGKYLVMSNISFFNNITAGNTRYTSSRITSPTAFVTIYPTIFGGYTMGNGLTNTVSTGSGWVHALVVFGGTGNFTLNLVANLDATTGVTSADVYSVATAIIKLG
jgi:hypothetical protein